MMKKSNKKDNIFLKVGKQRQKINNLRTNSIIPISKIL